MNLDFVKKLDAIAKEDVEGLKRAAESYGDSWKSRGGVGAFMMLARKWDRLENALRPNSASGPYAPVNKYAETGKQVSAYDIFAAIEADQRAEGIIDDIRDLRRYLMLVEAEMRARGHLQKATHRDNK